MLQFLITEVLAAGVIDDEECTLELKTEKLEKRIDQLMTNFRNRGDDDSIKLSWSRLSEQLFRVDKW